MTSIKTVAAVAFVALLVPVAAVAKEAKVHGPAALAGAGFFGGELKMAMADGQRPVRIIGAGGYVGILDLGGDLEVRCVGQGRAKVRKTEQGTVYMCAGRGGQATVLGSHFKFRGFANRYRAVFPAGVSGSFHGRFVQCTQGEDGWECGRLERPERPEATERKRAEPKERVSPKEAPAPKQDDAVPTLAELAAMLAGK
ncbi:MAG TPA: hypothetical protein VML35_02570 [Gaiellaceae bacterium]|nr:hypothetical protein [Gaiellaceae bacterium]